LVWRGPWVVRPRRVKGRHPPRKLKRTVRVYAEKSVLNTQGAPHMLMFRCWADTRKYEPKESQKSRGSPLLPFRGGKFLVRIHPTTVRPPLRLKSKEQKPPFGRRLRPTRHASRASCRSSRFAARLRAGRSPDTDYRRGDPVAWVMSSPPPIPWARFSQTGPRGHYKAESGQENRREASSSGGQRLGERR